MNNPNLAKDRFRFWLTHERLPLDQICLLAKDIEPVQIRRSLNALAQIWCNCPYHSMLMSGISSKEIKSVNGKEASPLESFLYFQSRDLDLPQNLSYLLENELDEIQEKLKKKIKRSRESYLRKNIRGDAEMLTAVLKTLLDLYPDYPKEELIFLKPVQIYANGSNHSDANLKNMITEIEKSAQKSRKQGNKTNKMKDSIKREIPDIWKPEFYSHNS